MANPTVEEVLGVLRPSFQGIDLRGIVVALGDKQEWRNVFTVIRFSDKTSQEISAEHDRLIKLNAIPAKILNKRSDGNTEPYKGMRIVLASITTDKLDQLLDGIEQNIVNVNDVHFRIFDRDLALKLKNQEMYPHWVADKWQTYYWGWGDQIANFDGTPNGQGKRPRLDSRDLDKQARSIGFTDFQQLAERIIEQSFGHGIGHAFQIFAPIYARIASVDQLNDSIKVIGDFHRALGDLMLECSLQENKQGDHRSGRSLGKKPVNRQTGNRKFIRYSRNFLLTESPESGRIQVSLYKQASTRVDLDNRQTSLGSGIRSYRAFTSFVPGQDITEYLRGLTSGTILNCKLLKKFISKEQSKVFEYVVTYLLALCHLNPILLSNLRHDFVNGGLEAGSADIMALAQDGSVILVSCTTGMPDRNKRDMLIAARTTIAQRINIFPRTIKLVLITSKPSVSESGEEIVELASTDLEQLWERIQGGNLSEARRLLGLESGSSIF